MHWCFLPPRFSWVFFYPVPSPSPHVALYYILSLFVFVRLPTTTFTPTIIFGGFSTKTSARRPTRSFAPSAGRPVLSERRCGRIVAVAATRSPQTSVAVEVGAAPLFPRPSRGRRSCWGASFGREDKCVECGQSALSEIVHSPPLHIEMHMLSFSPRKMCPPPPQEDSHEFLRCFLERMHANELRAAGVREGEGGDRRSETTSIHDIFGGYFRNQLHCPACGYDSNSFDAFLDVSLECAAPHIKSVEGALANFARPEVLDAANKWKCAGCARAVSASKTVSIRRPPAVLTIQLKRFSYTPVAPPPPPAGGKHAHHKKHGGSFGGMLGAMLGGGFFGGFGGFGGGRKLDRRLRFEQVLDIAPAMSDTAIREVRGGAGALGACWDKGPAGRTVCGPNLCFSGSGCLES